MANAMLSALGSSLGLNRSFLVGLTTHNALPQLWRELIAALKRGSPLTGPARDTLKNSCKLAAMSYRPTVNSARPSRACWQSRSRRRSTKHSARPRHHAWPYRLCEVQVYAAANCPFHWIPFQVPHVLKL